MTPTLVLTLTLALVFVILNGIFALTLRRYYLVPKAQEALLVVGPKGAKTYRNRGVLALPVFTTHTVIPLHPVELPIDLYVMRGVEMVGVVFVAVEGDDPSWLQLAAVCLCGTERHFEVEVRSKLHHSIQSAARSAMFDFKPDMPPDEIEVQIRDELYTDASKLGLKVISVSVHLIPHSAPDPDIDEGPRP